VVAIATLRGRGLPSGAYSDLYLPWYGARALLLDGQNPYSDAVTHRIQLGYFAGHIPAWAPADLQADAYPAHGALLLAPTLSLPFTAVARGYFLLFLVVLPLLVAATVWPLLAPRAPAQGASGASYRAAVLAAASCALSLAFWDGLYLGQLTVAVLAFLLAGVLCRRRGWPAAAGVFLALSTVKPQIGAFLLPALLLEALLARRYRLLAGFIITGSALVAGSLLVRPTWPHEYLAASRDYAHSYGVSANLWHWLPSTVAIACAILLAAGCAALWVWLGLKGRRIAGGTRAPDSPRRGRVLALATVATLAATVQVIPVPYPASYTQLPLWPALVALVAGDRLTGRRSLDLALKAGAWIIVASLLAASALGGWLGSLLHLAPPATATLVYDLAAGHFVGPLLAAGALLAGWSAATAKA
jgi:hypothetical protein